MRNPKTIVVIILILTVSIGIIVGYKLINNQVSEEGQSNQKEELINQSKKRADEQKEKEQSKIEGVPEEYIETSLTSKDIDLTKVYTREELITHAKLILGIISDETRKEAMENLPLTTEASSKHFPDVKNIFYGRFTDKVSINIKFAGLDYPTSNTSYMGYVLAEVTYYNEEGETNIETKNLLINYNNLLINSWVY